MTSFDYYHDLAAQLLGRDGFPLPLPNMDRNYPHNIGLLSDAEESALAAAVLQLTNGMSYESWKTLDMDQRVPWMEQAVKKAGADNRSNGVTRAAVIAELTNRVRAGLNVVTGDDVAGWPNGLLEQFVVDGILKPVANAKSIACDACGDDHVEPVQFVEAPPGSPLRAYTTCPENGRIQVPLDRLRCWRVNVEATPNAKSAEAGSPEFKLPENVTVQVTHSTEFLPTPSANDLKGLRDAADYCRAQAAKLGDASAKWWWVQAQVYDQQADKAESRPSPPRHGVSHALAVAHRDTLEAIDPALELYKRTVRFPNPTPVLSAIERFVHELRLVSEWHQELQRRSTMIEACCQVGSKFDVLRQKALSTHTNIPTTISGAKLALERLHSDGTRTPRFLQEVATVRRSAERLLQEPPDDISDAAIAAFKEWRDECRAIQLQAERLHVDGCWYLDQVYQASESDPTERSQAARAILQTDMGGGQLEEVHAAVESMFAWASENQPSDIEVATAEAVSATPSTTIVDDPLNERGQHVLIAMLELDAVDSDRRRTTEEIAVKALGDGTDPNALKNVMSDLKTRQYVLSKTGRGGGCWLTEKGQERARKLRGQ